MPAVQKAATALFEGLFYTSESDAKARRFRSFRDDPVGFSRTVLGGVPWSKQREIMDAVRDHDRVSVRSCHGIGKTWTMAAIVLWWLFTRPDSIVITTAPGWRQVKELLWREIRANFRRGSRRGWYYPEDPDAAPYDLSLFGTCNTADLQLADTSDLWYATGLSTDDPDRFQGFHSEYILVIVDEAAGVEEKIFEVIHAVLTTAGAKLVLIGNPTTSSGTFHASHHEASDRWKTFHVSAFDSPAFTGEVVPKRVLSHLVSPEWVEERKIEWGEGTAVYMARVDGNFPRQATDALMSLDWLEKADHAFTDPTVRPDPDEPVEAGMDVADDGDCENAFWVRQGRKILHKEFWRSVGKVPPGEELDWTINKAEFLCKHWGVESLKIDATGVGAGPASVLQSRGIPVVRVYVGIPSEFPEQYSMLRDEIFIALADRFRTGDIGPIQDDTTRAQLSSLKVSLDPRDRRVVESKKLMRKRGLPSPDRADALALAFYRGTQAAAGAAAADEVPDEDPTAEWRTDRNVNPWGEREGW